MGFHTHKEIWGGKNIERQPFEPLSTNVRVALAWDLGEWNSKHIRWKYKYMVLKSFFKKENGLFRRASSRCHEGSLKSTSGQMSCCGKPRIKVIIFLVWILKKQKKKGGGAEKAPKILAEVCAVRVCFLVALFCWWRLSVVKSAMFLSIHVLPV